MLKRFFSAVIAVFILSASFGVGASVEYTEEFATQLLNKLDIMRGDENGNLNLEKYLTRAEFAKIAVNSSKYRNSVALGAKISVFKDCTYKHWSAPYVKVAVTNGIITGYPDSTFRPDNHVTLEEAVTVVLRLLGYSDADFGNTWPYGQLNLAEKTGITKNLSATMGNPITREDTMKLIYNVLNTKMKDGSKEYASELDITLYSDTVVIATNKEDSSVAPGKVLTAAGTFNCNDSIGSYVGQKGSLAVNVTGEVVCFVPTASDSVAEYVVYSVLSDRIIAYHGGVMTELRLSDSTPVYSGADKLTFAGAKSDVETGDIIDVVSNRNGEIEYLTLTQDSMIGPDVLYSKNSEWYKAYTDNPSELIIIRNDTRVNADAIDMYDVLYYSKELNTVFAYANTVTGIYEDAQPSKDTPNSITLSGTQYEIETVDAFRKLSSTGEYKYGSSVTLLLGKDKGVVDVITSEKSADSDETVGFLTDVGVKQYETNGEKYTSRYVTVILPDGTSTEYKSDYDYTTMKNSVVKVEFKNDAAYLTRMASSGLSGRVSYNNMKIGSTPVSENVKILDVSTVQYEHKAVAIKTYMQRIDGINLTESSVLWYSKNSSGEISKLILDDVTGDTAVYGLVTEARIMGSGINASGNYTIDSNGTQYRFSGGIFANIKNITPVKLTVSGSEVQAIKTLTLISGKISGINGDLVSVGSSEYQLSDKVSVYKQMSVGNYAVMPLSEFKDTYKEYTVNMYTDNTRSRGGRIRVILVR